MIYSGKRNGLSVRAIQWTGTNLKEVWDFLEVYREKVGMVGLNFNFVKELPSTLALYENCPIRLTNRETHVIETIVAGSWIIQPLNTTKDDYLFMDNETFRDQFHKVVLQVELETTFKNISVALDKVKQNTIPSSYRASTFEQTMDDFSTSVPQLSEGRKRAIAMEQLSPIEMFKGIQTRMRILESLGFAINEDSNTGEEAIRLSAGVEILRQGKEIHPLPYSVADLQKWFMRLCNPDCIAAYSSIPVATKKFVKLSELPEPMLQFIIRFPVTNWDTVPADMTRSQVNTLIRMGKLLYTAKSPAAMVPFTYSKANRLKIMRQLMDAYRQYS